MTTRTVIKTKSEILWSFDSASVIYSEGVVELHFLMKNPVGMSASLAVFQFQKDSTWYDATLMGAQYEDVTDFPLTAKWREVIIRWDGASDLRLVQSWLSVPFRVAFNDRALGAGMETEVREHIMTEVDFTIQGEANVISPRSNDPYLNFNFITPLAVRPSRLHFLLEVDTVDTFDSGDYLVFNSRDDQTGWGFSGGAFPSEGVDGQLSNRVTFVDASLGAMTQTNIFYRITPIVDQVLVSFDSPTEGQVFVSTSIPVSGSVVVLD